MFTISLSNYECKIKIVSAKESGAELGSSTSVIIKRREYGDTAWTTIYTKSLSTVDDLDYTFYDKYTRSRRTYEYQVIPMSGETEGAAVESSIECAFDSIYITDFVDEYFLELNVEYDFDSNEQVVYQTLLNSKYPTRVQNGLSDYITGYIEALLLPLDSNNHYTSVGAQKYKQQFISFLKTRNQKYIKTYKGEAWLVMIDGSPKVNKADYEGAETIKFNWTECGDAPTSDES